MTSFIFVVGFFVTLAVAYALFAYTIAEMRHSREDDAEKGRRVSISVLRQHAEN